MVSDTSSRERKRPLRVASLVSCLRAQPARRVPLLVLRLPELERIAWRDGKRAALRLETAAVAAFMRAAAELLRAAGRVAHDRGSDVFLIAVGPPRGTAAGAASRATLERIGVRIRSVAQSAVECGWMHLDPELMSNDLRTECREALERGAKERERYEFFSVIGHELRTPLTSIRGYLDTLLEEDRDGSGHREFLETARRETLRLGRLIENMFEFSLLESTHDPQVQSVCDVADVVASACGILTPLAASCGVVVENTVRSSTTAALGADACLQAVINLLDNAIKHGRAGGKVRVAVEPASPYVRLTVDDDGTGIASAERHRIFTLRARGNGAVRAGTGIGLAIVRMIAERCGGEVTVADSPMGGARFELLLPQWESPPAAS